MDKKNINEWVKWSTECYFQGMNHVLKMLEAGASKEYIKDMRMDFEHDFKRILLRNTENLFKAEYNLKEFN